MLGKMGISIAKYNNVINTLHCFHYGFGMATICGIVLVLFHAYILWWKWICGKPLQYGHLHSIKTFAVTIMTGVNYTEMQFSTSIDRFESDII